MIDTDFVKALVDDAFLDGSSDYIEELRTIAKDAIKNGSGKHLVSVSENGKAYTFGTKTNEQLFAETTLALTSYLNGGFITNSTPDFTNIGI